MNSRWQHWQLLEIRFWLVFGILPVRIALLDANFNNQGLVNVAADVNWSDWAEWYVPGNGLHVQIKGRNFRSSWGTVVLASEVRMMGLLNQDQGTLQRFSSPPEEHPRNEANAPSVDSPAHQ